MDQLRDIHYVLELTEDVDYFDVILQIQINLRSVFSYNSYDKTITLIKFSITDSDDRLKNTSLYKLYGTNYKWEEDKMTYHNLSRILKNHEEDIAEGYLRNKIYFYGGDEPKEYSIDEINNLIKQKEIEFENLFVKEIKFTENELKFIEKIVKHPLLENKIKGFAWKERRFCNC